MMPTSLYIHIPWCIRKCPYCDFNSHQAPAKLAEENYIEALLNDFRQDLKAFTCPEIQTIFIGGGTPSLFSAAAYRALFKQLQQEIRFAPNIEITLEANPGTVEQRRFAAYRELGINRLSLGIQSFNEKHLQCLGRIHDVKQANEAIAVAQQAGFRNFNLDLMYGLPEQSVAEGIADLKQALSFNPEHLSWYQLTLEPNTVFYKKPPKLPPEALISDLEAEGLNLLRQQGYQRYEISAFCRSRPALHNLNYWQFGDYYGIGAGAHGKLTTLSGIYRTRKQRQPQDYLNGQKPFLAATERITASDLIFEFMLNATRLEQKIANELFTARTGLAFDQLYPLLQRAQEKNLLQLFADSWQITALGRRFTNDLQALFLA